MVTYKELKEEFDKKLENLESEYNRNVKEAEEEFNRKVTELQQTCKHPKISVVINHSSGKKNKEKICEICNAVVTKSKLTIHMP